MWMWGLKLLSLGTVTLPRRAVPQKAMVRQARTVASTGLLGSRAEQIVVRLLMVQGTLGSLLEAVGARRFPAARRACTSFSSVLQGMPCMMYQARTLQMKFLMVLAP